MQITREQAVGLLIFLNVPEKKASKYTDVQLIGKLNSIPGKLQEADLDKLEEGPERSLLLDVLAALEDGENLDLVSEEPKKKTGKKPKVEVSEEEVVSEEEKPKKNGKVKPAKTSGNGKAKVKAEKPTKEKKVKAEKPAKEKKASTGTKRAKSTIFEYSGTRVLKWMGANGFSKEDGRKVFDALGNGAITDVTIATAISDGRSEKYRKGMAELNPKQVKELKAALKS